MSTTCSSVETNEFNRLSSQDESYMNVVHLNIRSVNCNLSEFMLVLDQIKIRFNIIVLSETYLFSDENAPNIEGYTAFSVSRDRKRIHRGGGLLVYVSDKISSIKIDVMSRVFSSYESIGLEISLGKNNSFYLCGVYRPPSCKLQDFNHDFFEMIKASVGGKKCIILGDFNVNLLGLNSVLACQDFFDNFIDGNYTSLIDAPTRVTQTSKTCLDHIYVNFNENFFAGVLEISTSDHYATFCCIPKWLERVNNYAKHTFRSHSEEHKLALRRELTSSLNIFSSIF